MAFVLNKSKIQSVFQVKIKTPGPGAYQYINKQAQEQPAPFNSSTNKISYFDVQQTKYGPGSYNPDKIKIIQHKKIPISSSFISKVQRFKTQPQIKQKKQQSIICEFGPEKSFDSCNETKTKLKTQQNNKKQKKNYLQDFRKTNHQRKVDSIHNNKEFVRVLLSNPHNTQIQTSIYIDKSRVIKTQTGPGKYDIQTKHKGRSVICWSNDKQKRFKKQKSKSLAPGPGQYQLNEQKLNKCHHQSTSSFAYGGVRSFMDNIIYKTNIPIKAKILEFKQVKDRYPGPGQYSPQKIKNQSFYCGDQLLGAGVERFKNKSELIPGPGTYTSVCMTHDFTKTVRDARKKIFGKDNSLNRKYSQTQVIQPLIIQQQDKKKAEDQRLKNYCSLKQRCSSKYGSLCQQERFKNLQNANICLSKNNNMKKATPGPGQYKVQKNIKVQNKFGSVFKSKLEREVFKGEKQQIQLPFYNIQKHDIGYKAKRVKTNIQNLKKVFIQMVPFNSSEKRFSTQFQEEKQLMKYQKSLNLMDESNNKKKLELQASKTNNTFGKISNSTYHYKKTSQQKCSSSFKSTSNRQPFVSQSYNNLGPGSYENCTSLDKKSFNSQYNQELVQRMNIYGQPRSRTSLN